MYYYYSWLFLFNLDVHGKYRKIMPQASSKRVQTDKLFKA